MSVDLIKNKDLFVWTDLETSGLWSYHTIPTRKKSTCILEIGCIITDGMLQEIAQFNTLVAPLPKALEEMNGFVRKMHSKNGLLQDLYFQNPPHYKNAEKNFLMFLNSHKNNSGNMYLTGNSIAALDIPFLQYYMPSLWKNNGGPLHYRTVDISGLRISFGLMTGYNFSFHKKKGHRALDDVKECIAEFKYLQSQTSQFYCPTGTNW
jgi:oligoribonuclease